LIGVVRGYLGAGADWAGVARANGLAPPYVLQVGQELRIAGAHVARTEAAVALVPPAESGQEIAMRGLLRAPLEGPPPGAFEARETGLRLLDPLWEAFPWRVPAFAALGFVIVSAAAAAYALAGAPGRAASAGAARALGLGAAASGGATALAGGLAALLAGLLVRSAALELLTAAGIGAAAWLAARLTARARPGGGLAAEDALARRFAVAVGVGTAGALAAASLAGWTHSALEMLRFST
jgi:hypothetical protein